MLILGQNIFFIHDVNVLPNDNDLYLLSPWKGSTPVGIIIPGETVCYSCNIAFNSRILKYPL